MTFRAATLGDVPAIDAFLGKHLDTSVFLLTNLRRFGPSGGAHPFAMRYFVTGAPIVGVISQAMNGYVYPQWPEADDWRKALPVLPDPITGVIGDGGQCDAVLHAGGLRDIAMRMDGDETLMSLDLDRIRAQDGPGTLCPITRATRDLAIEWRRHALVTTQGEPEETAPDRAATEIAAYIEADSHRLLIDDETPLSMTGFNATLDHLVQVGGVYTPPDKRGRGLARRAVALHLKDARAAGATRGLLFADNPSALAAYRAVGFRDIGRFALKTFETGHRPR